MIDKLLVFGVALFALPGLASAADMPLKAPPPVPVASWSGCYIGGHAGGARAHYNDLVRFDDVNLPGGILPENVLASSYRTSGFAGGGQGGCQLQRGLVVFGLEGDWTSAKQSSQAAFSAPTELFSAGPDASTRGVSLNSLWSVRMRAGVTATENLYLYGTLGVGGAKYQYHYSLSDCDAFAACVNNAASFSINPKGFVFGGGAEYRLWSNVIVGAEYLHYALSNDFLLPPSTVLAGAGPTNGDRVNLQGVDVVRARLSYLFSWW
jgi:outer membrane immunogenic protein